jgi:pyruvate formate lyase activating enzyme
VTARIHSIETCGTVDGPGLRYVAFFQGCKLRCRYCHNPDTWKPAGGTLMTLDELIADIGKYASYMKFSGGGFTASGGEPLLQADFVTRLFEGLKNNGIHTALDTSGHGDLSGLDALLASTDLVLLDIKATQAESYRRITGVDIAPSLQFAQRLNQSNIPVWVRYVVVPQLTDREEDVARLAAYLRGFSNLQRVELLPFHKMGEHKWATFKLNYSLQNTPIPDAQALNRLKAMLAAQGLNVR